MNLRPAEIFERLTELSGRELEAELLRLCGDNSELLNDVRSLLAAHENAGGFLNPSLSEPTGIAETRPPASWPLISADI